MVPWARSSLAIMLVFLSVFLARTPMTLTGHSLARSPSQPSGPLGPSTHRTYWLRGGPGSTSWNGSLPGPELNASDGDSVTIMLQSIDGNTHSWFLDLNGNLVNDTNEAATVSPDFNSISTWTNFTLTTSLGTVIPHGGTFTYECRQHARFMYGSFKFIAGPVASFTHSPSTPLVGHPVLFNASTSWPSTGAMITDHSWDFGDASTISSGSSPTIIHSYGTNSTFTVVLNVTDSDAQTAQYTASITVLSSFDYQITVSPANSTITAGENVNPVVNLQLTAGPSQNVTLSSSISPKDSLVQQYLDVSNGYPPFNAVLHISTIASNLCVPDPCLLSKTYTITIMAVSGTGVNQNTTFTLVLKPSNSQSYNYLPIVATAALAAAAVLVFFMLYRRRKSKPGPLLSAQR